MYARRSVIPLIALLAVILVPSWGAAEMVRVDDLTVIETTTGERIEDPLPASPSEHAIQDGSLRARSLNDGFVGCSTSDNAFPFDLSSYATGEVIDLLPEGNYPYDATMSPDGSEVWFVGASGDGAVVVDRETNTVTHRIPTGDYPTSVAFRGDGTLALVSCRDSASVTLIDTGTYSAIGSLPLPAGMQGGNIALDPVSGRFYAVDWYDDFLIEISPDGTQVLRSADVGTSLWQVVVDPDGGAVYVTDRGTDVVHVVDPATLTVVRDVPVGDDPWGLDVTADGGRLVVTCEDSHDAYIIDTGTWVVTPIALDATADPRDVDILDADGLAFITGGVVGTTDDRVFLVDLSDAIVVDVFDGPGTNTNVIAVQPQVGGGSSGIAEVGLGESLHLAVFPNPARAAFEVRYSLVNPGAVDLFLFDAGGRQVRVLGDGARPAGSHRTRVTTDGLAAGVYFVRLDAGGASESVRLVVRR